MSQSNLKLRGCRQHNLKNLSISIPKGLLVAITGVSGSGKSSLAFDTIFAEGQRRYLESLSPQSRSWIKQLQRPELDHVEGLTPTLAIEQRITADHGRGTVGTQSDLLHYLRLLMARTSQQYSPATGDPLICYSRQEISDVILKDFVLGSKLQLIAPISLEDESLSDARARLLRMGFVRMRYDGQDLDAEDENLPAEKEGAQVELVVDRIALREGIRDRLGQSVETALDLSRGILAVQEGHAGPLHYYSEIYLCPKSGLRFPPLEPQDFNSQSPHGACSLCAGEGGVWTLNSEAFIWDPEQSISDQAEILIDLLPRGQAQHAHAALQAWLELRKIPLMASPEEIAPDSLCDLLEGTEEELSLNLGSRQVLSQWKGLFQLLSADLSERKSKSLVSELAFAGWIACSNCTGSGLKPEALHCRIGTDNIIELCERSVSDLLKMTQEWEFSGRAHAIAIELLPQIQRRLVFLIEVGLGYLALDRKITTLSEGEAQRVQLTSQLGAGLCGVTYVLDEPSLGLHPQDTEHLARMILALRDAGNSVLMVEHAATLIEAADHILEIGPGAGRMGGELVFQGSVSEIKNCESSPTGQWLQGLQESTPRKARSLTSRRFRIENASLHNLKNVNIDLPFGVLLGICGVSGSGKSSLILDVASEQILSTLRTRTPVNGIERLIRVGQHGPGVTSRSLPATFISLMTPLRKLFAETRLAKARGYGPGRFSLNKRGGRCEACEGLGQNRVHMQFMPDLYVPCGVCDGLRFNYETLQVSWKGQTLADVLAMTAIEALEHFEAIPEMADRLRLMTELGLEYLQLGQPFPSLSGGELQRLKLIAELSKKTSVPTLYVLDEPSRGLHACDVSKLTAILQRLVEAGHSVWVIEHNIDILRACDWLIELGPEGGPGGGSVLFEGTAKKLSSRKTPTGALL